MFRWKTRSKIERHTAAAGTADAYVTKAPSHQNAIDLFRGEWMTHLPPGFEELEAGILPLWYDEKVTWAIDELNGVEGQHVLELGPLEAGHTFMLEQRGAKRVTAVEANPRAFLRCLIVKEIVGLTRAHFFLGDALEHLRSTSERYDVIFASGILYHMRNPIELIALISENSDRVYLWTHYFDADRIAANKRIVHRFPGVTEELKHLGFKAVIHRHQYEDALVHPGFCGGSSNHSGWMERADVLGCLEHFGFDSLRVAFDDPGHENGPSLAVVAERSSR